MLSFKHGVNLSQLKPQLVLGLISIHSVFQELGYDVTITSVSDGVHRAGSLHYNGNACDLRIWAIDPTDIDHVISAVRKALGSDFDVILEADHLHVEYDPKTKEVSNVS